MKIGSHITIGHIRAIILIFLLTFLFVLFVLSIISTPKKNFPAVLSENSVSVSATIGNIQNYSLFGYTSERAHVSLSGIGLLKETKADKKGFFEFKDFLAPVGVREFCLTSVDTENRVSMPLCIPAPQHYSANMALGPYLLPPSIEVSSGIAVAGTEITVTGKTIPATAVDISLFHEKKANSALIKSVMAAQNAEQKKVMASADGSYTARITSNEQETIRLFAQSRFNNQRTPKSNTLSIQLISALLQYFARLWEYMLRLLSPNMLLFLEIMAVVILVYTRFNWAHYFHKKKRAMLMRIQNTLPILQNYTPLPTDVFTRDKN